MDPDKFDVLYCGERLIFAVNGLSPEVAAHAGTYKKQIISNSKSPVLAVNKNAYSMVWAGGCSPKVFP